MKCNFSAMLAMALKDKTFHVMETSIWEMRYVDSSSCVDKYTIVRFNSEQKECTGHGYVCGLLHERRLIYNDLHTTVISTEDRSDFCTLSKHITFIIEQVEKRLCH